jgi:hypothetical protein
MGTIRHSSGIPGQAIWRIRIFNSHIRAIDCELHSNYTDIIAGISGYVYDVIYLSTILGEGNGYLGCDGIR